MDFVIIIVIYVLFWIILLLSGFFIIKQRVSDRKKREKDLSEEVNRLSERVKVLKQGQSDEK
ncbi:hypothetical protein [Halobacillus campisalis]|uniref:DUF4083 domain-containing protein n=1 Tax=Halobacillus campisalis TaxID=435909 RepID=A0ABW2K167_9BACI|nr:hypothetical protein [Halobacillus campisalis]